MQKQLKSSTGLQKLVLLHIAKLSFAKAILVISNAMKTRLQTVAHMGNFVAHSLLSSRTANEHAALKRPTFHINICISKIAHNSNLRQHCKLAKNRGNSPLFLAAIVVFFTLGVVHYFRAKTLTFFH